MIPARELLRTTALPMLVPFKFHLLHILSSTEFTRGHTARFFPKSSPKTLKLLQQKLISWSGTSASPLLPVKCQKSAPWRVFCLFVCLNLVLIKDWNACWLHFHQARSIQGTYRPLQQYPHNAAACQTPCTSVPTPAAPRPGRTVVVLYTPRHRVALPSSIQWFPSHC